MNTEDGTAFTLKYGSLMGILIIAVGLVAYLADLAHGETIMVAGIAATVFTPFAGMFVSFVTLSANKEKRYAASAFALIIITTAGMLAAFFL